MSATDSTETWELVANLLGLLSEATLMKVEGVAFVYLSEVQDSGEFIIVGIYPDLL